MNNTLRLIILAAFLLSMIFTPADAVSMLLAVTGLLLIALPCYWLGRKDAQLTHVVERSC